MQHQPLDDPRLVIHTQDSGTFLRVHAATSSDPVVSATRRTASSQLNGAFTASRYRESILESGGSSALKTDASSAATSECPRTKAPRTSNSVCVTRSG